MFTLEIQNENKGFTVFENVLFDFDISDGAFKLYILLHSMSYNKDYCYPSQEYLGQKLKKSKRQIIRLIEELETQGLVIKQKTYTKENRRSNNTYRLPDIRKIPSDKNVTTINTDFLQEKEQKPSKIGSDKNVTYPSDKNVTLRKISINNGLDRLGQDKEEHLPFIKALGDNGIVADYQVNKILDIVDRKQPNIDQFREALHKYNDCELSGMCIENPIGFISHKIVEVMEADNLCLAVDFKRKRVKGRNSRIG